MVCGAAARTSRIGEFCTRTGLRGRSISAGGRVCRRCSTGLQAEAKSDLHLDVSVRSFRAEKVAAWVRAVIDGDTAGAQEHAGEGLAAVSDRDLTRNLAYGAGVVEEGTRAVRERYGLVASSDAIRLKPCGIYSEVEDQRGELVSQESDQRRAFGVCASWRTLRPSLTFRGWSWTGLRICWTRTTGTTVNGGRTIDYSGSQVAECERRHEAYVSGKCVSGVVDPGTAGDGDLCAGGERGSPDSAGLVQLRRHAVSLLPRERLRWAQSEEPYNNISTSLPRPSANSFSRSRRFSSQSSRMITCNPVRARDIPTYATP